MSILRSFFVSLVFVFLGGAFVEVRAQNVDLGTWHGYGGIADGCAGTVLSEAVAANGDLYVGGAFRVCGDVAASTIARWDGTSWSALGAGANGAVNAIAISGTDIYIAGQFSAVGGVAANNIAHWDGSAWHALDTGLASNGAGGLALLVVGSDLYAGGDFDTAGGIAVSGIARWDGSAWHALGSGLTIGASSPGTVNALASFQGSLVAAGNFSQAGGNAANNIAAWDGLQWTALDTGLNSMAFSLASTGAILYAGGSFSTAGGTTVNNIAAWNGSAWSALGTPPNTGVLPGSVLALAYDGTKLYVGGQFTQAGGATASHVASWDGSQWASLDTGIVALQTSRVVRALAVDKGKVYAGGAFNVAGGTFAHFIAAWDGSNWSALSATTPGNGIASTVQTVGAYQGNFCVGSFWFAEYGQGQMVCANGAGGWTALGGTPFGAFDGVEALATSGNSLYIGYGNFDGACCLNEWNGSTLAGVGPAGNAGMDSDVFAIAVSGSNVYAGGDFSMAGGVTTNFIARWDGSAWNALGSGMDADVDTLAISGSTLYAGGSFANAGGAPAANIAQWNGTTWSSLGSGTDGNVYALLVVGQDLYVGGAFAHAGGVAANNIARWDGSAWHSVGAGVSNSLGDSFVNALALLGSDVYVAGRFDTADGVAAKDIAIWNRSTFRSLGSVGGGIESEGSVGALTVIGRDIYIGGQFGSAGGQVSSAVAHYTPDQIFENGFE